MKENQSREARYATGKKKRSVRVLVKDTLSHSERGSATIYYQSIDLQILHS